MIYMKVNQGINRVDRSRAVLIRGKKQASDYVDAPASVRVAMVWELTEELWSITGRADAQQRLQRNVAAFERK
jgi:hypothetical protein